MTDEVANQFSWFGKRTKNGKKCPIQAYAVIELVKGRGYYYYRNILTVLLYFLLSRSIEVN